LITSSISAFPGVSLEMPRADAKVCAQNVGRTGTNFQCRVKTINGLFARRRDFGGREPDRYDESPSNKPDGSSGQQMAINGQ
jgi:hypothetical protein